MAFVSALAAFPSPLVSGQSGNPQPSTPLKVIAASRGIRFGASARVSSLRDHDFVKLLQREADVTAAANAFKWHVMARNSREPDYNRIDHFVGFAERLGFRQRGHAIIWDKKQYIPSWAKDIIDTANGAEALILERTHTLVSRYRGRLASWDVVNEGVNWNTGKFENGPLFRALGIEYAALAFHAAHDADPLAELVYNDYVLPHHPMHQTGVLDFLDKMERRHAPVTTVGLQGHIKLAAAGKGLRDWERFLSELAARNLSIIVTELDVTDDGPQNDVRARDILAADAMAEFMSVTLAQNAVKEVMVRSLTDRYEGLTYALPRADKGKRRPAPFDYANRPKPLRDALAWAFANAPSR